MSNKNIILIGLSGCGKTTIGKALAKKLQRKFVDLDEEIEKSENMKIHEIIKQHDWNYFRDIEQKICTIFAKKENIIISTGGGIVEREQNIINLKKNGKIILINCPIEICAKRITNPSLRPLLIGKNIISELQTIWENRKNQYKEASDIEIFDDGKKSITALNKLIIESLELKVFLES